MTRQQKFQKLVDAVNVANHNGHHSAYQTAKEELAEFCRRNAQHITVRSNKPDAVVTTR